MTEQLTAEASALSQQNPVPFRPPALLCIATLLVVIIFFGLIRYRLRTMPLERDEGEYALSGQLMLQGIPPYKLAYNLKLPGTYAAYAAILAVFGQTPAGIHLGFLFVNAATSLLMYVLAARLFGRLAGVVTGASYALLSTSPSILGFQAHATHFIVLPSIVGLLLLLSALDSSRSWLFFASGLFCGVAFLMKQHGAFVPVFCLLYLVVRARKQREDSRNLKGAPSNLCLGGVYFPLRNVTFFVLGVILPCALTWWLLYRAGVFSQFWFWTVSYAGEYSKMGLRRGIRVFDQNFRAVAAPTALIWLLAGLGIIALRWSPSARKHAWFLIALLLLSFLAICPGVQFRAHYFVLLLPPVALLAGVAVSSATEIFIEQSKSRLLVALPVLAFVTCFASTILEQRTFYFSLSPDQALRAAYPADSEIFLAAPRIAQYLSDHASLSSRIAVVGSEPEIYFYAHRLPATGYIYMYSLTERQRYTDQMRRQMIQEMESNRPQYLIYVDAPDSWGYQDSAAPQVAALFSWAKDYIRDHYEQVGVADLDASIQYVWADASQNYVQRSPQSIHVFRRKD
jgi:4-amino-4-deoxy-L-arabinose transferase-like glycosyltransferase